MDNRTSEETASVATRRSQEALGEAAPSQDSLSTAGGASPGVSAASRGSNPNRNVALILGAVLAAIFAVALFLAFGANSTSSSATSEAPAVNPPSGAQAQGQAANAMQPRAQATNGVQAAPPSPMVFTAAPVASTPRDIAGAHRRDATVACKAGEWDRCKADLDQAATLDPEGDKIFAVQRLRQMAEKRGN